MLLSLQDEKNQILTTNSWLNLVSIHLNIIYLKLFFFCYIFCIEIPLDSVRLWSWVCASLNWLIYSMCCNWVGYHFWYSQVAFVANKNVKNFFLFNHFHNFWLSHFNFAHCGECNQYRTEFASFATILWIVLSNMWWYICRRKVHIVTLTSLQ